MHPLALDNHYSGKAYLPSRSRRDRLHALYRHWDDQIPLLADVYLSWKHGLAESATGSEAEGRAFVITAVETNSMLSFILVHNLTIL